MTGSEAYRATFRADLAAIYERLKPRTVGCFDLVELSLVPLEDLVVGGSHTWFVDGQAGRMRALLAAEIGRAGDRAACLACVPSVDGLDICAAYAPKTSGEVRSCQSRSALPRDPEYCTQFAPGRRLRVINGDARRGRGASFATRVETVLASAACPTEAVKEAIEVCKRSAQVDVPLPIEDGLLDLVISVLAPVRLMEQPFAYFDELMTRRFGAWLADPSPELAAEIDELRQTLFLTQLEAHMRELARLTHPGHGRMYFATLPLEPENTGAWSLDRGIADCVDALSRHFSFDFETFPAEAFLRRSRDDQSIVLQAAVLRRKPARGVQP
ncbi:MAG TPA: hypothetical protein VLB44_01555 [Kofleriaceae bacterium]|nr:hypothetical protein [Kofleriaceae bacterium]